IVFARDGGPVLPLPERNNDEESLRQGQRTDHADGMDDLPQWAHLCRAHPGDLVDRRPEHRRCHHRRPRQRRRVLLPVVLLRQDRHASHGRSGGLCRRGTRPPYDRRPALPALRFDEAEGGRVEFGDPQRLRHRTVSRTVRGVRDPGLLEKLDRDEVEVVLAHELSHVAHRDVTVMTVAGVTGVVAALMMRAGYYMSFGRSSNNNNGIPIQLLFILVGAVVYGLSFILIRSLSRYRELAADRAAAILTGAPSTLASALTKLSGDMSKIPEKDLR